MEEITQGVIVGILIGLLILLFIIPSIVNRHKRRMIEKDGRIKELELTMQAIQANLNGNAQELAKKFFDEWKLREWQDYKVTADKAGEEMGKLLFAQWCIDHEDRIRKDTAKRTIAVNMGRMTEHLIPFSEQFKDFNPKDARFIGSPIDLIVFDGISDKRDEVTIHFIEVKTGTSAITDTQRKIWRAIEEHRIKWRMIKRDEFKWESDGQSFS